MRSIPFAMVWEMFTHRRWSLIAAALGANVFPVILLTALRHDGPVPAGDSSMILMHVVLMQTNMFVFGMAMIASQGNPSRLFTYPVTSATIVAWQFLPAMVLMGVELVVSTAILNAVFDLNWPLWGPALLVSVAVPAIQAVLWWTEKSGWLPWGMVLVGGIFGLWFKTRYGPLSALPDHYWSLITPGEIATMFTAAVCAFAVAVLALDRNRRGESLGSLGIVAWLDRMLEPAITFGTSGTSFETATRAQLWFEWRQKGWAMPVTVVFAMFVGGCGWLLFNRDLDQLFANSVISGGFLSVVGLIGGLVMGNSGPHDAKYEIGSFLATRPMSTPDLARTILRVAARSVLVTWLIWATALAALFLLLIALGIPFGPASSEIRQQLGWWYFPATLVGCWTVVGVGTSIGLLGRETLFVKLLCGALTIWLALLLGMKLGLSYEFQKILAHVAGWVVGLLCLLGTIGIFVVAGRRLLIGWSLAYVGASAWAGLASLVAIWWWSQSLAPLTMLVLILGVSALAVAPLAAAPLALSLNRNR